MVSPARAPLLLALLLAACSSESSGDGVVGAGSGDGAVASLDARASDTGIADTSAGGDGALPEASADGSASTGSSDASTEVPPAKPGLPYLYVSGYAPPIAAYAMSATGSLTSKENKTASGSPSFLALNPANTLLFAVDESTNGRVASFAIDQTTGALTAKNDVSSGGAGPAHVAVDHSGKWAMAANYGGGTVALLPIHTDGTLGDAVDTETPGTNPHESVFDPANAYVFVPCKGSDYIASYVFDAATGKLTPNPKGALVHTKAGAGPRHLTFHPNHAFAYGINEIDSTMTAYAYDAADGTLSAKQTESTLPSGFSGTNTAAEVWVHPSGNFVYGSNRGDDSIVVFALDATTGGMTLVGHVKTGGQTPRDFTLDPTGGFLFVANQGSNNVVTFRVEATGLITQLGNPLAASSPSFVGFAVLPPAM